jgi:hypothetical protein
MTYEIIYILTVLIITFFALYIYINQEYEHQQELDKIERLEVEYEAKRKLLEEIRAKTIACPISGLNTPRDCYFGSNYACSWNEKAVRCDKR